MADSQTVSYTVDDFDGLFTYLEFKCDGPKLITCETGDTNSMDAEAFLLEVDQCLYSSNCLSYHQSL